MDHPETNRQLLDGERTAVTEDELRERLRSLRVFDCELPGPDRERRHIRLGYARDGERWTRSLLWP